jgi:hypothetical protein
VFVENNPVNFCDPFGLCKDDASYLDREQGKRAIEALKEANNLGNDAHNQIMGNGDVRDWRGRVIDNIYDYLP